MIINTRHGLVNIQHPQDYISSMLIKAGEYEWYVVDIVSRLCAGHSTGTVLDIGANIGIVCLPIAKQYPSYQVHAFEAQAPVTEMLAENIVLNDLNNISVHAYALGEKNSTVSIAHPNYSKAENIGAFSLDPYVREQSEIARGHGELFTIPVKILDDMQFDQPIRCIKLDVEGYEERILLGGLNTLKEHNYPPIVYEMWAYNDWWKYNAANLRKLLELLGYNIHTVDDTAVAIHEKLSS